MPRGGVNLIPLIRATFAGLFRVNCQTLGCHARPALDGTIRWKSNAPSLAPRDFHPDPLHTQSYWPFHPSHPAIYSSIPISTFCPSSILILIPSTTHSHPLTRELILRVTVCQADHILLVAFHLDFLPHSFSLSPSKITMSEVRQRAPAGQAEKAQLIREAEENEISEGKK